MEGQENIKKYSKIGTARLINIKVIKNDKDVIYEGLVDEAEDDIKELYYSKVNLDSNIITFYVYDKIPENYSIFLNKSSTNVTKNEKKCNDETILKKDEKNNISFNDLVLDLDNDSNSGLRKTKNFDKEGSIYLNKNMKKISEYQIDSDIMKIFKSESSRSSNIIICSKNRTFYLEDYYDDVEEEELYGEEEIYGEEKKSYEEEQDWGSSICRFNRINFPYNYQKHVDTKNISYLQKENIKSNKNDDIYTEHSHSTDEYDGKTDLDLQKIIEIQEEDIPENLKR